MRDVLSQVPDWAWVGLASAGGFGIFAGALHRACEAMEWPGPSAGESLRAAFAVLLASAAFQAAFHFGVAVPLTGEGIRLRALFDWIGRARFPALDARAACLLGAACLQWLILGLVVSVARGNSLRDAATWGASLVLPARVALQSVAVAFFVALGALGLSVALGVPALVVYLAWQGKWAIAVVVAAVAVLFVLALRFGGGGGGTWAGSSAGGYEPVRPPGGTTESPRVPGPTYAPPPMSAPPSSSLPRREEGFGKTYGPGPTQPPNAPNSWTR